MITRFFFTNLQKAKEAEQDAALYNLAAYCKPAIDSDFDVYGFSEQDRQGNYIVTVRGLSTDIRKWVPTTSYEKVLWPILNSGKNRGKSFIWFKEEFDNVVLKK